MRKLTNKLSFALVWIAVFVASRKLVDKLAVATAIIAVFVTGTGTYAFLNVVTRSEVEMISTTFELPQRKGVVTLWDPIDPDVGLGGPPDWYTDYETNQREYDEPFIFTNSRTYTDEEYVCMAKNIYFEARQESTKGQILVALVTLERVEDPRWPNNVCDVVYDHKQFSWYWDGLPDFPQNTKSFTSVALVASAVMSQDTALRDFTYNATHYHADYVQPFWSHHLVKLVQVDTHIAYREEPEINASL